MLERGDSPHRTSDTGGLVTPDRSFDRPPYKPERGDRPYRSGLKCGYRAVYRTGKSGRMPGRMSDCAMPYNRRVSDRAYRAIYRKAV